MMKTLLTWRAQTAETSFEIAPDSDAEITEQEYYDKGIFLVAMIKAGVENLRLILWWQQVLSKNQLTMNHCMKRH